MKNPPDEAMHRTKTFLEEARITKSKMVITTFEFNSSNK